MRILLGFFEAFLAPTAYSIISDTFPQEKRTIALSTYGFGGYFGAFLSQLTLLIILSLGWRATYALAGFFGTIVGIVAMIIIREPGRGVYDPRKIDIDLD